MIGYIIRRLIVAVVVTVGIGVITFLLLHALSGSPVRAVLGPKASPAAIASWNKLHGYDRPEIVQMASYVWDIFHFNFGYSYKQGQSVAALFKEDFGRSAYLSGVALVLSVLIAIPIGIAGQETTPFTAIGAF